jgi:hypothetical protein
VRSVSDSCPIRVRLATDSRPIADRFSGHPVRFIGHLCGANGLLTLTRYEPALCECGNPCGRPQRARPQGWGQAGIGRRQGKDGLADPRGGRCGRRSIGSGHALKSRSQKEKAGTKPAFLRTWHPDHGRPKRSLALTCLAATAGMWHLDIKSLFSPLDAHATSTWSKATAAET